MDISTLIIFIAKNIINVKPKGIRQANGTIKFERKVLRKSVLQLSKGCEVYIIYPTQVQTNLMNPKLSTPNPKIESNPLVRILKINIIVQFGILKK